ncbi:MAG: DinB family protein [Pyrinomonadaceae bacterium]|nr:DinB family protein [Pyrinomonadaceae bacterium]
MQARVNLKRFATDLPNEELAARPNGSPSVAFHLRHIAEINHALETLQNVPIESLFAERFVGRKKLPTNVFGLMFHIAEHTARHVGQTVTTAKIVSAKTSGQSNGQQRI